MHGPWKPPFYDPFAIAIVGSALAVVALAFLVLGLRPSPVVLTVAAIVIVTPIAEAAILRRRMGDIWYSQRLYVDSFEGDLAGAIEAALAEAGLPAERVSLARTPMGPEREVLLLGDGLNVTVISAPRGHVVYAGPDREPTRKAVERVKAAVDAALAGEGS